jgi:hypothetical protein
MDYKEGHFPSPRSKRGITGNNSKGSFHFGGCLFLLNLEDWVSGQTPPGRGKT